MLSLFRRQDTILEIKPPRPARGADLGPKQIEYCEKSIPNFKYCKAAADAAQRTATLTNEATLAGSSGWAEGSAHRKKD